MSAPPESPGQLTWQAHIFSATKNRDIWASARHLRAPHGTSQMLLEARESGVQVAHCEATPCALGIRWHKPSLPTLIVLQPQCQTCKSPSLTGKKTAWGLPPCTAPFYSPPPPPFFPSPSSSLSPSSPPAQDSPGGHKAPSALPTPMQSAPGVAGDPGAWSGAVTAGAGRSAWHPMGLCAIVLWWPQNHLLPSHWETVHALFFVALEKP